MKNIRYIAIAILTIMSFNIFSMQRLGQTPLITSSKLEETLLMHVNKKFFIRHKGSTQLVQSAWVDKNLRNLTTLQLANYLKHGNMLDVNKADDGSFSIKEHIKAPGGGLGGATFGFYAGKFAVHFVGHGAMLIAAALTGPAAPATYLALEATFALPLEAASNVVAVGASIATAVATGPV